MKALMVFLALSIAGVDSAAAQSPAEVVAAFHAALAAEYAWAPRSLVRRLARAYGTRASAILDGARSMADLGEEFGAGLTLREVDYLRGVEFARGVDDMLWRRSKLELHMSQEQQTRLAAALA